MSVYQRPLALTDDGKRHEPMQPGRLLEPDVVPVSADKDNLITRGDDGLKFAAQDILSQTEKILSVTDNKLKTTLSLKLNSATNVLELLGANDVKIGEVKLPVVPGLPVVAEILKNFTPPAMDYGEQPEGVYMHLQFQMSDGTVKDIYYNVSDFVDIYTGGDGIDVTDNTISFVPEEGKGLRVHREGAYVKPDELVAQGEKVLQVVNDKFQTQLSFAVDGGTLILRGKDNAEVARIALPFSGETLTFAEFLKDFTPPPPHGADASVLPESNYLHLHFDSAAGEKDVYIDFGEMLGKAIWGKRVEVLPEGDELDALLEDMPVGAYVYAYGEDDTVVYLTPEEGDTRYVSLTGSQTIAGVKTFGISPVMPTPQAGDSSNKAATTKFVADAIAGFRTDDDVKLVGDQTVGGIKTFTDSPLVPTPDAGDKSTKTANTGFVANAIDIALTNADQFVRLIGDQSIEGVKTFDASPQVPTAPEGDNTLNAASTQFVTGAIARAHASAPTLVRTGGDQVIDGKKTFLQAPVIPTQPYTDNSTKAASTAFVHAVVENVALDASNAVQLQGNQLVAGVKMFSDSPVVPTAQALDSSGKAASTEFVMQTQWALRGTPSDTSALPTGALVYDPATPDNPEVYLTPEEGDERYLSKTDESVATKAYVDDAVRSVEVDTTAVVTLAGAQTVDGIKTFTASPIVPTAATNDKTGKVASTQFVANALATLNDVKTTGDQAISGTKTFGNIPIIPTAAAGDDSTNAASTAFVNAAITATVWIKYVSGELPDDVSALIADMPVGAVVISED